MKYGMHEALGSACYMIPTSYDVVVTNTASRLCSLVASYLAERGLSTEELMLLNCGARQDS